MCVCTATTNGQTRQTSCLSPLSQQHVRRVILIIISQLLLLHCYNLYYSAFLAKKKSVPIHNTSEVPGRVAADAKNCWFNAADFDINRCTLVVQEEHISSHGVVIFKLASNLCWADIKSADPKRKRLAKVIGVSESPLCSWLLTVYVV